MSNNRMLKIKKKHFFLEVIKKIPNFVAICRYYARKGPVYLCDEECRENNRIKF
jgi:hypothetical protein